MWLYTETRPHETLKFINAYELNGDVKTSTYIHTYKMNV